MNALVPVCEPVEFAHGQMSAEFPQILFLYLYSIIGTRGDLQRTKCRKLGYSEVLIVF